VKCSGPRRKASGTQINGVEDAKRDVRNKNIKNVRPNDTIHPKVLNDVYKLYETPGHSRYLCNVPVVFNRPKKRLFGKI